jgi:competence transcription factor ComK
LNSTRSKACRDEADCLFDLDSAVTRSVQWRGSMYLGCVRHGPGRRSCRRW